MPERIYIALDLETTGLDAHSDAIIEVGAVRFAYDHRAGRFACRIIDRFVTFVNPLRSIPLRVQQLTGIRDADVASAPTLGLVIPELLAFVTADVEAVVAHNAGFDFGFLGAAGIDFHRPTQDTFELASILLPGASSYSLGELARVLEIPLPEAHRALDDASATAQLFTYLLTCLEQLPAWIPATLCAAGEESGWAPVSLMAPLATVPPPPAPPLREELGTALGEVLASDPRGEHGESRVPAPMEAQNAAVVAANDISAFFDGDGPLKALFGADYEWRQGQVDMAERVMNALKTGDHLLIEAGTGTGKSLAYLLPSALWSLGGEAPPESGGAAPVGEQRRVVIATNTIALQEQLMDKDIPILNAALAAQGKPTPRSTLLKGRGNYLCTRRLAAWYRNRRLSELELRVLAKVLVWLQHTKSGDVSELFLPTQAERMIWTRFCSDSATCSEDRCHGRQGTPSVRQHPAQDSKQPADPPALDFFFRARRAAEQAHLLVVNHALLLADIAAEDRLLPAYRHVIIDEAHHLEEAATEQLSYRVDWSLTSALMQRMHAQGDLAQGVHFGLRRQGDDDGERALRQVSATAQGATANLGHFAQALLNFARQQDALRTDSGYAQRLGLDSRVRTQPAWSELEIQWDNLSREVRTLTRKLGALIAHLDQHGWGEREPFSALLQELLGAEMHLAGLLGWLDKIIFMPAGPAEGDVVTWMEVNESMNEATVVAAPLYVNETLETALVHRKRVAIFTGATLRTGSGFSFIRDRLGLWEVTASTVDSPFDYQSSTLLYLPSDLPEPNQGQYQHAVEQAIIKAAVASDGSTLVLFTSYAQLRATAEAIRAPLDRQGITVLQHGSSSRRRLLREYRASARAVLLGTRSFWEGIDLPGDELRCLLIVRLPFAVPSDPLVAARSAELENPFRDYTLPDAILRFRQGFGRLIRRVTDRGVVVVLDSRLWRKQYGQAFLESLPACTTRHAPLANLDVEIERWLKRPAAGQTAIAPNQPATRDLRDVRD